ncbi:MAG TPA: hypothetical protein VJ227_04185 [Patescibacteria group bacterium]|nr:hypothetical protein [Patescibacteria group bacterium]
MQPFGIFLLAVVAFIGTVLFLTNPFYEAEKWVRGKGMGDVDKEVKHKIKEKPGKTFLSCAGLVVTSFIVMFLDFVAVPLAVITALVNKIGDQQIAYGVLAIVGLKVIRLVRTAINHNKNVALAEAAIKQNEEIKLGNPVWKWIKRFFLFLPILYLWYLFLILIGVIG